MIVRQGSPEFTEGLAMILRLAQDERGFILLLGTVKPYPDLRQDISFTPTKLFAPFALFAAKVAYASYSLPLFTRPLPL